MMWKHSFSLEQSRHSFRFWVTVILLLISFNSLVLFAVGAFIGNIYRSEFDSFLKILDPKFYVHYSAFIIFIALISAGLVTVVFIRTQVKPFHQLMDGMKKLKQGDFDTRVNIHSRSSHEFRELSGTFNALAKELGSTELLRKDFINHFSHEFKTPIMSIRGFAKILKTQDLTEEERDEYLDIIVSQSEKLSKLSTNILTLCKIENQTIPHHQEAVCLSEQVRLAILMLEPEWAKKQLNLDIQVEDVNFFGNKELCDHIWCNLIGNAIKFSYPNQDLIVKLYEDSQFVHFSVTDFGIGMNEDTIRHIFDQFYQGDATRAIHGNGIGLSIVKLVVEQYGGTIQVESSPGAGATFTVKLPKK